VNGQDPLFELPEGERASGRGIGGHHAPFRGDSDDWLTPRWVLTALGPFDLDPCASTAQPWPTARHHYAPPVDGLRAPWHGRVWCNPPYGPATYAWLRRLADHGDGVALTFARTETEGFSDAAWGRADALLFLRGRLTFHRPDGRQAEHNSGGPSVLLAYGAANVRALAECGLPGALVTGWRVSDADGELSLLTLLGP
jgi:DNA N-6-adenine-methyltransferase (Dam)